MNLKHKLQVQFEEETGTPSVNSKKQFEINYVLWLEKNLYASQPKDHPKGGKIECKHEFDIDPEYNTRCSKCGFLPNGGESETVFRKVSVKERLPTESSRYFFIEKNDFEVAIMFDPKDKAKEIYVYSYCTHWLEEVSIPPSKGGELLSDEDLKDVFNTICPYTIPQFVSSFKEGFWSAINYLRSAPPSKSIEIEGLMRSLESGIKDAEHFMQPKFEGSTYGDTKLDAITVHTARKECYEEMLSKIQSISSQTKTNT